MKSTVDTHEFNFVVGYVNGEGLTVMSPDKLVRMEVDHNTPITLSRCEHILQKASVLSGRSLGRIVIHHCVYEKTEGNELGECDEKCLLNKRYDYTLSSNSLLIFQDDEPVYANDDGAVCSDQAALYDSM